MQQLFKNIFTFSLFLTTLALSSNCSSDDGVDCTEVITTIDATINSSSNSVCLGESATVTITGTANTVVNYLEDGVAKSVTLDGTGSSSWEVSPTATTNYKLENIVLDGCEKPLTKELDISIGGPVITENVIGTWMVTDANNQTDGKTVTFLGDGTGTAPMDGAFTMYSSTLDEFSDGFTWEVVASPEDLDIRFNFVALPYFVRYKVDLNDCDQLVLRDVTHVAEPQNEFILVRQ